MKILICAFILLIEFKGFCQLKPILGSQLNHTTDSTKQTVEESQIKLVPAQTNVIALETDTLYYFSFENNSAEDFLPIFQYSNQNIRWHRKKLGELFPTYSNTRYDEGTVTAINERDELTRFEMISPTLTVSPSYNTVGFDYKIFIRHKIFNFENNIFHPARVTLEFEDNNFKYDYFLSHDSEEIFSIKLNQERDGHVWLNRPFKLRFYFIGQERGDFWCIKDITISKILHVEMSHLTTGSGTSGPTGPR